MDERFSRTELLLGPDNLKKLASAKVAVFGLGGVGGYAAEALARSGIGAFVLVDHDTVSVSNINRQILAASQTVGRYKADLMKERILSINPGAQVTARREFFLPGNADEFDFTEFSYVVDAVDTVTAKLEIISRAKLAGVPVISCMGTGNKLDPTRIRVADLYETTVCPLARVMRRECRKRGIESLRVVYSDEEQRKPIRPVDSSGPGSGETAESESGLSVPAKRQKDVPGSSAFVPPAAGLTAASAVVRDLLGLYKEE
ncbi:MAG: tRNA threonylcarbamoyladenosine dehydratase [Lachnospiraceae bacterium]|nr:tRNA threonylcarbamoyladenosine dehydratase [Lachnospiraceae bacterium]